MVSGRCVTGEFEGPRRDGASIDARLCAACETVVTDLSAMRDDDARQPRFGHPGNIDQYGFASLTTRANEGRAIRRAK
jgi:hypothetical protein